MMGHSVIGTPVRRAWRRRTKNSWLGASVLALGALSPMACSSGDSGSPKVPGPPEVPTADVEVDVTYPNDAAETVTASLHVWVLVPDGDAGVTCADLIGGSVDPYDLVFERHGDAVSTEGGSSATAPDVELGKGLIYVEAVDVEGNIEYAGCGSIDVKEPTTKASIDLEKARVFDCSDAKTEDGAPCDDGDVCTVDEKCDGGECRGGKSRDCSHLSTSCNAVRCDPEMGCLADPLDDGTPCDDDQYCTTGDECADGECHGQARDCSSEASACQVSLGCNEALDQCEFSDAPSGTLCDDGQYCTENDQCDYYGNCTGSPRDCTAGGCQTGTCNEALDQCDTTPVSAGTYCNDDDPCTSGEQCDSAGNCVGTPVDCSYLDSGCTVGVCDSVLGCTTMTAVPGGSCDDNDPCTENDVCDAVGSCSGDPIDCSDLDTECEVGTCNSLTGACEAADRAYGTLCDDSDPCTTGEYCAYGVCTYGTPVVPADGGTCP